VVFRQTAPVDGVRGPRFESHRGWLCLSWQLLWYTALGPDSPRKAFLGIILVHAQTFPFSTLLARAQQQCGIWLPVYCRNLYFSICWILGGSSLVKALLYSLYCVTWIDRYSWIYQLRWFLRPGVTLNRVIHVRLVLTSPLYCDTSLLLFTHAIYTYNSFSYYRLKT